MTDRFVRSTDGSDGDSGLSWALADATFSAASGSDAAGDTIYVSAAHSEIAAASVNHVWNGTAASPVRILCVDDTGDPASPTTLATSCLVSTTGASGVTISGHCYQYGITYQLTDVASAANLLMGTGNNDVQVYENCNFVCRGTGASQIRPSGSSSNLPKVHWKNCGVKFSATAQTINLTQANFIWEGGSLLSGTTSPSNLINGAGASRGAFATISGLDLSNGGSGMHLFAGSGYSAIIRNCKLPASWSGQLYNGVMTAGGRVEMYNCDSADTNYRIWVKEYTAELIQELTIVKASGASDGTTALAWKITTTTNCNFASGRFQSPEIVKWNEATGSSLTATVEILHDSLTALNDDEVWLEVQYLGTSGYPLGTFTSDAKSGVLATATAQASSGASWTTTGLTNPNTQKLGVTFTPQEKGYIHAVVCVGKISYTIYADPLLTVA